MFLNCCKTSAITKTQPKAEGVTDNEKWAEPLLQQGGVLVGSQLCCCLGANRNFLQEHSIGKAVGFQKVTKSGFELIKIHHTEARALGEAHVPTTSWRAVFVTAGKETEIWKHMNATSKVVTSLFGDCVKGASFSSWWKTKTQQNHEHLYNSCFDCVRVLAALQPGTRCSGRQVQRSPWLTPATLVLCGDSSLSGKVTWWRDPQALLLTTLNHSECKPTPNQTFHSRHACAPLHCLWKWVNPLFQNEGPCSKNTVLRSAGSMISQVRVKTTDTKLFWRAGLGRAEEGLWQWFSGRELYWPRSRDARSSVWG